MANGAANRDEVRTATADRSRTAGNGRGRCRRSQVMHEDLKEQDVAGAAGSVSAVRMTDVLRVADLGKVQAARRKSSSTRTAVTVFSRQWAVLLEEFVADAHLHVVSLARKDHQRFVLRLPAKAADGAVIAVMVEATGNAKRVARLGCLIVQQGGVVDVRHQARAKHRRR